MTFDIWCEKVYDQLKSRNEFKGNLMITYNSGNDNVFYKISNVASMKSLVIGASDLEKFYKEYYQAKLTETASISMAVNYIMTMFNKWFLL